MKRHGKTLNDVFRGRSPNISYFYVFGCPVHIHNHRDHLGKFHEKVDDGFFLGYSPVAKAFRVFNIRRQEIEETVHVTFSEDDEAISQSSTEGDAINFNENRSFPDDEFFEPRSEVTQCPGNTNDVKPSPTIPPSADIILQTPVPQDRWSKEKHIELVNIIGDPYTGITTRNFKGISICQEKYVKDLLKKYDLADCASVKCPMLPPNNLGPDKLGVSVNETLFKATIWSLMYLTASRPDIQFSICLCARYQANPKESHLVAIKRIFRYLKGTLNLGLWYPKGSGFDLKAYSDLEYAGCNLDRNSTSGDCQILGGKLIKSQLVDYDVLYDKVPIFCDNTSAIALSNNSVLHSRTKHIDIRYHFIRDHILKGDIELHFVPTDLQLADIFTKPLAEPSFTTLVAELGNLHDKPMSFTQDEFVSSIGLPICKDAVPLPPKETIRARKDYVSNDLTLSLLPPSGKVNADDTADKYLSRASVQPVIQSKATTDLKTKKKKISPSSKLKSPYKVRVILPKKQVAETQHTEVTVAIANATKSLEASELAEEQGNRPSTAETVKVLDQNVEEEKDAEFMAMEEVAKEQSLEIPTVKQLLDEADKLNKVVQETRESPYDTESEIKVVKSFFTNHISELKDQTMHDSKETANIHEDTTDSDDTHENKVSQSDHIFQDDHAFIERLSLPDHMDHICKKVSSLYSRLEDMESSIVQQISAEFKSSLPALLLKDSIKSSISKSIAEDLTHVEAQVQKNLQDQLPNLLLKPMYKEFNAFHKMKSQKFVLLQKKLSKSLHKNMKKSIRLNANVEGEKWEKNNPAEEKDAQHPDQTKGEQISGANIADNVQGEQPSARVVINEEKALVVHNPEEKKEGIISIEDDSDDDDLDK
ncbi:hypothetical protein Tco_1335193 [Tanacetum coccineum]